MSHILDAVDPFILLLGGGGRDTVHHVISFHYPPVSLRLTCFNQLTTVVGDVQLETVLERKTGDCSNNQNIYYAYDTTLVCIVQDVANLQVFLGLQPHGYSGFPME